jgi:hypothetical protein
MFVSPAEYVPDVVLVRLVEAKVATLSVAGPVELAVIVIVTVWRITAVTLRTEPVAVLPVMAFAVCLPSVPALLVALTGRSSSETSSITDVIDAVADVPVSAFLFSSVRLPTLEVALTNVSPLETRSDNDVIDAVAVTPESACVLAFADIAPTDPGLAVAERPVNCFRVCRAKVVTDPVALTPVGVSVIKGVAKAVGVPTLPVADTADGASCWPLSRSPTLPDMLTPDRDFGIPGSMSRTIVVPLTPLTATVVGRVTGVHESLGPVSITDQDIVEP